jgi:ribosomal protein L11 methyltransferase
VFSLTLECQAEEAEILSAELWERGASGIEEEDLPGERRRLRAWFAEAAGLEEEFAAWQPRLKEEQDVDWEEAARRAWPGRAVGERFWLAAEWDNEPAPEGRVRLTVHPGLALGTGAHPATQLCLMALERHARAGELVLDVGTGTGILMEAASALGARAAGCDIEHEAARAARSNLGREAMVFTGSARAVRAGAADVIVANINAAAHEALTAEYWRAARRLLILSGFETRQKARVADAARRHGWRVEEEIRQEGWECLVLCREERS